MLISSTILPGRVYSYQAVIKHTVLPLPRRLLPMPTKTFSTEATLNLVALGFWIPSTATANNRPTLIISTSMTYKQLKFNMFTRVVTLLPHPLSSTLAWTCSSTFTSWDPYFSEWSRSPQKSTPITLRTLRVVLLSSLSLNPPIPLLPLNSYRMNLLLFRMDTEQEKRQSWRRGPTPRPLTSRTGEQLTEGTDPGTKLPWFKSQLGHLPASDLRHITEPMSQFSHLSNWESAHSYLIGLL